MDFGLAGLGKTPLSEPFTCYIVHQDELDKIVNEIVKNYENGITSMSVPYNCDLSEDDLKYIEKEVLKRCQN